MTSMRSTGLGLLTLLLTIPTTSMAVYPTIVEFGGDVVGIDNLEIEGILYDIELVDGNFNDLNDGTNFAFLGEFEIGDYETALRAAHQIAYTLQLKRNLATNYGGPVPFKLSGSSPTYVHYINWNSNSDEPTGFTRRPTWQDYSFSTAKRSGPFVDIDISPWSSSDAVMPLSNDTISVAIMGKDIFDGDDFSFNVDQIDPATLKLGASGAANIAITPLIGDYDSDGNDDAVFAFPTGDTGILCGDTEVTLTGETLLGGPFEGTATITTEGCDVIRDWSAGTLTVVSEDFIFRYVDEEAGNEQFALNVLGSATNVAFSIGRASSNLMNLYEAQPGVTTTSLGFAKITPNVLAGFDLLLLYVGPYSDFSPYSDAEQAAIRDFLLAGNDVVFMADTGVNLDDGFYNMETYDLLLEGVGSSIHYINGTRPLLGRHNVDTIVPSPLTTGVTQIVVDDYFDYSVNRNTALGGGTAIIKDQGFTLASYEVIAPAVVEVDVDPWNAGGTVDPESTGSMTVAILGSSISSGDVEDFDVTNIDPGSLKLGPAAAKTTVISPLYDDYDDDTNNDAAFTFNIQDTGIVCEDTDVIVQGETVTGEIFQGTGSISTDCDGGGCHP